MLQFTKFQEFWKNSEKNLDKMSEFLAIVKLRSVRLLFTILFLKNDLFLYSRPYANLYTLAEFIFNEYKDTMEELGFTVSDLWDFFHSTHANAIRNVHVEQDHSVNNIR